MNVLVAADAPGDDEFGRARDLFERAMDIDRARRDEFVVRECGSDAGLLARVRKLLEAEARGEQFLEHPTHLSDPIAARPPYLVPGQQVGPYRIERQLGEGGMGVVYLAFGGNLRRWVAIKALSPAYAHDPQRRERLRREALAASALKHPGIPTVFDFPEHEGQLFIISEYVQGETLRAEISRGAASAAHVIETAVGIASALAAAHDNGIVHRDVKPENIMRTPDGEIRLLDFGLARLRDSASSDLVLTQPGSVLGTVGYMSPEHIRHHRVDGRTDLFALGILMHEMATGVHPFAAGNAASTIARILETEAPPIGPPAAARSGDAGAQVMWAALDAIIQKCLRKEPGDRFGSAHELLLALKGAREGRGGSVVTTGAFGPQRWWRVHHLATCIAYAGLMVPMWLARLSIDRPSGSRLGLLLFLATLGAAVASIVLRLHLWFTASSIPGQWARQYRHATPWLRLSDSLTVVGLLGAGGTLIAVNNQQDGLAAVLICAAVICGLSFSVIEPATTRAAFDEGS